MKNFSMHFLIICIIIALISCDKNDLNNDDSSLPITDNDGNIYTTVTIGDQTWMIENLKTTKYNDGTDIPNINDNTEWTETEIGAYCNYNDFDSTIYTYGRLYNWYAVNSGKLAPRGWHIPTDLEWAALINYLGGDSIAAEKLKEAGNIHWRESNVVSTNESGFTALPGGYVRLNQGPAYMYTVGNWWSSTDSSNNLAWYRSMNFQDNKVYRFAVSKNLGFSIRCIKDN